LNFGRKSSQRKNRNLDIDTILASAIGIIYGSAYFNRLLSYKAEKADK
jgi:hypothetical protein